MSGTTAIPLREGDDPVEAAFLQNIYDQIPGGMDCGSCTACCGPVPFSILELARAQRAKPLIDPLKALKRLAAGDHRVSCPYANAGCDIYEVRPVICRLFGAFEGDPMMTCPFGKKPPKPLSTERGREINGQYHGLVFGEQARKLGVDFGID